jgi:hypothetical protein
MSLLGLKQFVIRVFILLVMVNFIFRGKSVISATLRIRGILVL